MSHKGSIMEAAQNRPSFQTYLPTTNPDQPATPLHRQGSFSGTQSQSHGNLHRRDSEPYSPDVVRRKKDLNATKRHSMLVESNLTKEAKEINRRSHDVTIVKNLSMGWHHRSHTPVSTLERNDYYIKLRIISVWEFVKERSMLYDARAMSVQFAAQVAYYRICVTCCAACTCAHNRNTSHNVI